MRNKRNGTARFHASAFPYSIIRLGLSVRTGSRVVKASPPGVPSRSIISSSMKTFFVCREL